MLHRMSVRIKLKNKDRVMWLDGVRAFACIMVIVLHVSAQMVVKYKTMEPINWHIVNILDSLVRSCVPLFFMVSGFIFLSNKEIKIKNILRIIYCLVFYSLLAVVYMLAMNKYNPIDRLMDIFETPVFYHLWFFYSMLGCYVLFSFVKCRVSNNYVALFFLLAVFLIVNPVTYQAIGLMGVHVKSKFFIDGSFIYLFLYTIAGCLIGNANTRNLGVVVPLGVFLVSSIITAFLVYYTTSEAGRFNSAFYNNNSPFVFMAAVSMFVLIKNYYTEKEVGNIVIFIASLSLPIYGVHALMLDVLISMGLINETRPVITTVSVAFIVLLASAFVAYFIKKYDKKGLVS